MRILLLHLLATGIVNGVTDQAEINPRTASDGRHPPFITTFKIPATEFELPEGTIMTGTGNPGEAEPAAATDNTENIIGVLQRRVSAGETHGNIMVHGSCPAEILKVIGTDGPVDATAEQIAALRGVGVYV